jgi:hypothetical protein
VQRQSREAFTYHAFRFTIQLMAKPESKPRANRDSKKHVTREYVHSLRGKFKGKGLLKALMAEKKREKSARLVKAH